MILLSIKVDVTGANKKKYPWVQMVVPGVVVDVYFVVGIAPHGAKGSCKYL